MFVHEEGPPSVTMTLPQVSRMVALAEETTTEGSEPGDTKIEAFEVGGMDALRGAVIVRVRSLGTGGHSGFTEALIDRAGEIRIGYEREGS